MLIQRIRYAQPAVIGTESGRPDDVVHFNGGTIGKIYGTVLRFYRFRFQCDLFLPDQLANSTAICAPELPLPTTKTEPASRLPGLR